MKDMLKYENGVWTMNNLMLAYLLDETAHLALEHFRKAKKSERDKLVNGLVKIQFETLVNVVNMANELFETPNKPAKTKLKLIKTKVKNKAENQI